MYSLTSILGNSQKLDGGAMFGNVPKAVWSKWMVPDELNRISLACRALLIQDGNKTILLETGIGAFFNPKLRERYGVVESNHILLESLARLGMSDADIDIIILSHLHFDHAGGLLSTWSKHENCRLLFPNAKYVVSKEAWERACRPHMRDRASFIPELNALLEKSDRLIIIDSPSSDILGKDFNFRLTNGHTPGLLHTILRLRDDGFLIFASDLIPATPWVHLPITMGYDRSPELLIDEKKDILKFALMNNGRLFYTHDPRIALSRVFEDESGKFNVSDAVYHIEKLEL